MDGNTAYQVVQVTPETRGAFEAVDRITWFDEPDPSDPEPTGELDLARSFAATPTGAPPFAGIYSSFDLRLSVPGIGGAVQQVDCAGLTYVGVHPDHRRRGVLTTMLAHHLAEVHDREVAVGALHASEVGIYGRYGYAQASLHVSMTLPGGHTLDAPEVDTEGTTSELVDLAGSGTYERARAVHLAAASQDVGHVVLTEAHMRRRFRDQPSSLRGSEPGRVLFVVRDGVDVGYALLRRTQSWGDDAVPRGVLDCWELVALDPAARLVLLRRLLSFDLIETVKVPARSLDDEMIWWSGGPRGCDLRVFDSLWVRLVDVGAALEQRGYAADADIVMEVADEHCSWNHRRWRLTVRDGRGRCVPCDHPADLSMPVSALGAAYLGGRPIAGLLRAGWVVEHTPGAGRALGRALATELTPGGAAMF